MTIFQLKKHFFSELSPQFLLTELNGFWHYCQDFELNTNSKEMIINPEKVVDETLLKRMNNIIDRLKKNEPIQYIVGYAWFNQLKFRVNRHVLIPRPETEELVHKILEECKNKSKTIMDIGTGSGCIAIALKHSNPILEVSALDISKDALEIAQANANEICGKHTITFIKHNILDLKLSDQLTSTFDIIVSNPPYIPLKEKELLPLNVLDFEPHLALFSENDALLFYDVIAKQAKQLLNSNGLIFFETHENYAVEVKQLLKKHSFVDIEMFKDLQGKNRIIKAKLIS